MSITQSSLSNEPEILMVETDYLYVPREYRRPEIDPIRTCPNCKTMIWDPQLIYCPVCGTFAIQVKESAK